MKRATAAATKPTKITKNTKTAFVFFVIFVSFVIFVPQPSAVSANPVSWDRLDQGVAGRRRRREIAKLATAQMMYV